MGFWQNVDREIQYLGTMNRKTLSFITGIPVQTINRAIQRDSRVYLDDALKVAAALNRPVEYFLDINDVAAQNTDELFEKNPLQLYSKHKKLISDCEFLSESDIKVVNQVAHTLAEKTYGYTK